MKTIERAVADNDKIVLWGLGKCFFKYIDTIREHISVKCVCDKDLSKIGKTFYGLYCIAPEELEEGDFVVIVIQNPAVIREIKVSLGEKNDFCTLDEALVFCNIQDEEKIVDENERMLSPDDTKWDNVMRKYVGIHVPATTCNLSCPYCYIRQKGEFSKEPVVGHSPRYIRLCLSQRRLGGQALIGICGAGETLLCDKIVDICVELLKEGHYLHLVTNGTVTAQICKLVQRAGRYVKHIFFKFSFHYEEFERRGLLDVFAGNVNYVSQAGASFTVELTSDDRLISRIEDIKQFSMQHFGALPHVTIARDETDSKLPILTKLPKEDYYRAWSEFQSELFEVKWEYFGRPIRNCFAGKYSIYIDLQTGSIKRCLGQPSVDNLYCLEDKSLEYKCVGDDCTLPYCFNNHAYLTLGVVPGIRTVSFAQVRDRMRANGTHWVQSEVYRFIDQRLYENNR